MYFMYTYYINVYPYVVCFSGHVGMCVIQLAIPQEIIKTPSMNPKSKRR